MTSTSTSATTEATEATEATDEALTAPAASDAGAGWIVGIVAMCVLLTVANTSMVNVALPAIGDQFGASAARLGWLVTAYSLTFGVATPFYGRLGDRYGLRRMFVIGLCIFAAASLLAGIAPSFPLLLLARALQAFGSAAIPSLGIAMIARVIPSERRGSALGIVATAVGTGSALGPTLGGVLTQFVSWRMVFLVSAALGLLIPFCLRHLPTGRGGQLGPIDWFGGVTLGATIAGLLLGIAGIQREGLGSPLVVGSLSVAVVALGLTIWRQRTALSPFVDRVLVANRRYLLLCVIGFCAMAGNIGTLVVAPFLFKEIHGLSAGETGLALLPSAVAVTLLSRFAGKLADRVNPFMLMTGGFAVSLTTVTIMATLGVGWSAPMFAMLAVGLGVGQAFLNSPLSTTLTRTVPQRVYGSGLGIYNMLFFVGSGFGAALSTAVLDSRRDASTGLPLYTGPSEYAEFSWAFLVAISAFASGLVLLRFAARANPAMPAIEQ